MNRIESLESVIDQVNASDVTALRNYFFSNPTKPMIATGSGGALNSAEFACLLYGLIGGVGSAVSPYTVNSYSDLALANAKLLLVSAGGHNNDIEFTAKRFLSVNPSCTGSFTLKINDRNKVRTVLAKANNPNSFDIPIKYQSAFVSYNCIIAYFALLCKAFCPELSLDRFKNELEHPYTIIRNDNSPLSISDLKNISSLVVLHAGWSRPVASNVESKLAESGIGSVSMCDLRNYCHGRFIFTSAHLEDSAILMFVSPREQSLVQKIRKFLPACAKLILIETEEDNPTASLDFLIKWTLLYFDLCDIKHISLESPSNPGKIDKRIPINIPFVSDLKKQGPLHLSHLL